MMQFNQMRDKKNLLKMEFTIQKYTSIDRKEKKLMHNQQVIKKNQYYQVFLKKKIKKLKEKNKRNSRNNKTIMTLIKMSMQIQTKVMWIQKIDSKLLLNKVIWKKEENN